MRFRADVTVQSLTSPNHDPLVLKDVEVEMAYDYVDHDPANDLIVQHLSITPRELSPQDEEHTE